MPITPFHFGPGLFFKAYAPTRMSWVVFALGNILIDVEPVAWFLLTGDPAHRQLHSYLGAAAVAAISVWPGRMLGESWLRWWNRSLSPAQARWLGTQTHISLPAAWSGALLGVFSHVLLDSFMHADMQPFWPWAADNGLLQEVSVDGLHLLCVAAGLWGALRLGMRAWLKLPDGRFGRNLRVAGRLFDQVATGVILLLAASFIVMRIPVTPAMDKAAFDPAVWRRAAPKQFYDNPRAPMARAAQRYLQALRPSRSGASALLGTPDAGEWPARISYHLGFSGWLAMDPDTLDIEFAADGRFIAAHIVQH